MDAKSSAAVPLPSPAAAQRCAKGAGLDSGTAAAAQSAMPSIALPATASTADLLSTNAAAPAVPQLPSVSNLHQLDGRDLTQLAHAQRRCPLTTSPWNDAGYPICARYVG